MKVEKHTLENHHAKITVEVEPELIEKAKQRAARQLANRVKIPGFRPGKAPYHIIERTLGAEAIMQQAYEFMGEEIFSKALDEAGVKPYAPAAFTPPSEQNPTTFEFTFPMEAEVNLSEYRTIRIPYELPPTSEEEVEKTLTDLRERNAVIEPVDRAAQPGDEITIKLSGKRTKPEEEADPSLISERTQTILIKAAAEASEWPFPGFSQQLVGLSNGEQKTVTYIFPDDSAYTSLRGKEAEYHIEVEQVKSRTLPELNDDFAKTIGDFETLQALQDTIREGLKSQAKANYDADYNEQVLAQVIDSAEIKYPPEMVEDQISASTERMKNQLAEQGQEFETYLKIRGMDAAAFREQNRPQAEMAIKRSLVMYELARVESISVDRKEMENEAMNTLNDLMRYVSPDQFKRMSKDQNFIHQISRNASVDVLSRKTFERLNAIAQGEIAASEVAASEVAASEVAASETAANAVPTGDAGDSEPPISESSSGEVLASETAIPAPAPETEPEPVVEETAAAEAPPREEIAAANTSVPETNPQEG